jgi:putative acetyltransferase
LLLLPFLYLADMDITLINIVRIDTDHPHFLGLVQRLDAELAERDGPDHAFYAQFNKTAALAHAVVAYLDGQPVGSGALKPFAEGTMEVKRMYTLPEQRGKGVAATVLAALEQWAAELGCQRCVLETGHNQPEALAMYHKHGYQRIPNYGQYAEVGNSVCFEKLLQS